MANKKSGKSNASGKAIKARSGKAAASKPGKKDRRTTSLQKHVSEHGIVIKDDTGLSKGAIYIRFGGL